VLKAGALFSPIEIIGRKEIGVHGRNHCARRWQSQLVVVLGLSVRKRQGIIRTHARPVAIIIWLILLRIVVGRPKSKHTSRKAILNICESFYSPLAVLVDVVRRVVELLSRTATPVAVLGH
jgi:hypothetical protein